MKYLLIISLFLYTESLFANSNYPDSAYAKSDYKTPRANETIYYFHFMDPDNAYSEFNVHVRGTITYNEHYAVMNIRNFHLPFKLIEKTQTSFVYGGYLGNKKTIVTIQRYQQSKNIIFETLIEKKQMFIMGRRNNK